jgi:rare lipoprotein A (peptidoglycan hydrolase)
VIDRGPYANNASWDLTIATSDALNFTAVGVDRIGALVLRGRATPLN